MKCFWRFLLRKSLPVDSLKEVAVAVFGLGDSGVSGLDFCTYLILFAGGERCLAYRLPVTSQRQDIDSAESVQACRLSELQHRGQEAGQTSGSTWGLCGL